MESAKRRVVITGLGVVSPLGCEVEEVWGRLRAGESGVGRLSRVDPTPFDRDRAAEVQGFSDLAEAHDKRLQGFGQAVSYVTAAARQALVDGGLELSAQRADDIGIVIGTTMGCQDIVERIIDRYHLGIAELPPAVESAEAMARIHATDLVKVVAQRFCLEGPAMVLPIACTAGNCALAVGAHLITRGDCDLMLVGGADPMSRACYTIFHRLGASTADVCRPFNHDRTGIVVGEGAGMLLVEEYEHAVARGAKIYAEVLGWGIACDAYHRTAPHPEGLGAIAAMQAAFTSANVAPESVGYISAHGTGTRANDSSEAAAMATVFGKRVSSIPVSSIKSMLGHTMGAASALEAVVCALALRDGIVPPTANTTTCDPSFPIPLDVVPGTARNVEITCVISNAFAFGGCVSTVVFGRPHPAGAYLSRQQG